MCHPYLRLKSLRLSLQKGVYIAVLDVVLCVLCATVTFALFYHQVDNVLDSQTADYPIKNEFNNFKQTDVENTSFSPNSSTTDGTPLTSSWNAIISTPFPYADVAISTSLATPNEKNCTSIEQVHPKMIDLLSPDFFIGGYMILMVFGFIIYVFYILLEIWMCRILIGACSKRDASKMKKWFWMRLTITIFSILISLAGIATFSNDWVDWLLDTVIIYRVYELYVVTEFRKEILATGGFVRFGV